MVTLVMRKKDLELILEKVPLFHEPKLYLEQYITPSSIAADMVWEAYMRGDIEGKVVADLGCGTGRLALASSLLGAKMTLCIDIDAEPLILMAMHLNNICLDAIYKKGIIEVIVNDIKWNTIRKADTVVQNPPFGIRSSTRDTDFLRTAFKIANKVYSLHRSNNASRVYLREYASMYGFNAHIIKVYDFPIPQLHEKHKRRIHYIKVDYWLFARRRRTQDE